MIGDRRLLYRIDDSVEGLEGIRSVASYPGEAHRVPENESLELPGI